MPLSSLHAFERPDDVEARNNQLHNSRGVSNLIHCEGPTSEAVNCNASEGANLTRPRHVLHIHYPWPRRKCRPNQFGGVL